MANTKEDDKTEVFVPVNYSNQKDTSVYVAVNGVGMLIPRGKKVKVPKPYAQLLENAEEERAKQMKKAKK